jgi:hypothetical protein
VELVGDGAARRLPKPAHRRWFTEGRACVARGGKVEAATLVLSGADLRSRRAVRARRLQLAAGQMGRRVVVREGLVREREVRVGG